MHEYHLRRRVVELRGDGPVVARLATAANREAQRAAMMIRRLCRPPALCLELVCQKQRMMFRPHSWQARSPQAHRAAAAPFCRTPGGEGRFSRWQIRRQFLAPARAAVSPSPASHLQRRPAHHPRTQPLAACGPCLTVKADGRCTAPRPLNITLQGIEEAAGTRYCKNGKLVPGTPAVIVYADDLVALCHSRQQAETARERLATWLAPKGLRFNQQKTRIGPITAGFDFLSFSIRRYQAKDGGKVLTRPGKEALIKIRRRMKASCAPCGAHPPRLSSTRLNPVIRGQAAYYRTGASKRTFNALDHYMWRPLYLWALRQHRRKNRRWVKNHYFGRHNKARDDTWVFGDRKPGAYLHKYSWTPIVRHAPVAGRASPDDPALAQYRADRRQRHRRQAPPLAPSTQRAMHAQRGRCPHCGELLLHAGQPPDSPSQRETWFRVIRAAITRQAITVHTADGQTGDHHPRLMHTDCHRRHPDGTTDRTAR